MHSHTWMTKFAIAIVLGMATCWTYVDETKTHSGVMDGMESHKAMDMAGMHGMHMHSNMIIRTQFSNEIPDVTLIGTHGEKVHLRSELDNSPVMVDFVFTTCNTICPALTATFAEAQQRLAKEGIKAHLVSISIDPEHDTPTRLKAYAAKFNAGPGWQFLTGSLADSIAVQKAFDAYRGDKMNHTALTLLRTSPHSPWVRIDGFISASELTAEYRKAVDASLAQR